MDKQPSSTKLTTTLKIISLLLGAGLIILGFYNFLAFDITDPINVVIPVYYM